MNIKIVFFIIILISISVITTLIYQNTQRADINYYRGHRYFEKGDYKKTIEFCERTLAIDPLHQGALRDAAYACQWTGDYQRAIEVFNKLLSLNPQDQQIKKALAQTLSWNKELKKSVSLYEEILQTEAKPEVKQELADVLSWDKQYDEALDLYDEVLEESGDILEASGDIKAHLQKARVLGWARRYKESLQEYQRILDIQYNELVELEMEAKKAYWDKRLKQAISYYKELVEKDAQNVEAMFDLSQIYSYQSMWEDAIVEYNRILEISPLHFRAKESLEKVNLIAKQVSLKTGYEFFEADSQGRNTDIKRHSFFNHLNVPVSDAFTLKADYKVTGRNFSDSGDILENEAKVGFNYIKAPEWRMGGFYDFIAYNKGINGVHTFGADINRRIFDATVANFSFQRQRLENTSQVLKGSYYRDNYKGRLDTDINKRLRLGADYLYSNYSDDNYKYEPGADILYYLSLDPKRFAIKYRYFYREFDEKTTEYFSPKDFSTHSLKLDWRHFLNKEEIFFGADDIYYDLGYKVSVDSTDIVGHTFNAEFSWDINKRLNINVKGAVTNSSADVYKDRNISASLKYYF